MHHHTTTTLTLLSLLFLYLVSGCTDTNGNTTTTDRVERVEVTGTAPDVTFAVTLATSDTGCTHYADWWEVVTEDGKTLLGRRILAHSHVEEQPFTRSAAITAQPTQRVVIRLHMNDTGYAQDAQIGSIQDGFTPITLEDGFGGALETQPPLPSGCAF